MATSPTVPMYAPDGTLGDIPYDKMHDALQAGGKMGVNFLAPDGTKGIIPADRVQDAQKAGGKIVPYGQTEESPKSTYQKLTETDTTTKNPVARFLSNVGGTVLGAPAAIGHAIAHPIDTATGIVDATDQALKDYENPATRPTAGGALSVLPEALGQGVGSVAAGEMAGAGVGGLKVGSDLARQSIGKAINNPAVEDALLHPQKIPLVVAKKLFPAPPEFPGASLPLAEEFYAQRAEDLSKRGIQQDALDRRTLAEGKAVPLSRSPNAVANADRTLSGQNTPISQGPNYIANQALIDLESEARKAVPLNQSPYYNQAQEAIAADAEARKPVSLSQSPNYAINKDKALTGQSSSLSESPNAEVNKGKTLSGQNVPLSQSPNARINAAKADALDEVYGPQAGGESGLSLQDIISRTKRLVVPGEEPSAADLKRAGDLTQAPTPRLRELAKFGDRLAQIELNRRLKNQ